MTFFLDGPPSRWVSRGGLPALVTMKAPLFGCPSYESEDGKLVVFELLVVTIDEPEIQDARSFAYITRDNQLLTPRSYGSTATRSKIFEAGLVPLHDDPEALWTWRPLLYRYTDGGLTRLGSQQELEWRQGVAEAMGFTQELEDAIWKLSESCADDGVPYEEFRERGERMIVEMRLKRRSARSAASTPSWLPFLDANARARLLLLEHLNPQQQLDLAAWGHFHARGVINPLYRIEPGNGASIVDPFTRKETTSLCLHTEEWIPHDDVALATKLLIESGPVGELEALDGARAKKKRPDLRSRRRDREAWRLERTLLPVPLLAPDS